MRLIWIRQCNAGKYFYAVWKGRFPKELTRHPRQRKPYPKQSCLHPKQICVSSSPPSTWLLTASKIRTLFGSVRQGCIRELRVFKSRAQSAAAGLFLVIWRNPSIYKIVRLGFPENPGLGLFFPQTKSGMIREQSPFPFQSVNRKCLVFHLGNAGGCNYSRNIFRESGIRHFISLP